MYKKSFNLVKIPQIYKNCKIVVVVNQKEKEKKKWKKMLLRWDSNLRASVFQSKALFIELEIQLFPSDAFYVFC